MKRLSSSCAALAVLVAACGGGTTVVATVDGTEITIAEVEELYSSDAGAVPNEQFARNLLNTIVELVVIQTADSEYGISFTDEEIEERRADLESQVVAQGGGATYEEFLETNGFTNERIFRIAHQQLVADAVEVELLADEAAITEDDLQDAYDAGLFGFTEACVSHILVETEEEALAARERIEGGETFAEVAMDVGTDGTAPNGGELGCTPLSNYVPEFALGALEVPIDQTSQPVQSQFGFHLILVTERTTQSYEDVEEQLRTQLAAERAGTLVQDWLLGIVTDASVTVDEEYGSWVTDPVPNVVPPA